MVLHKIIKLLILTFGIFLFSLNLYAEDSKLKLDKVNWNNLEISWEKMDWVDSYYVSYDDKNPKWKDYTYSLEDFVSNTNTIIPNLEKNKTYYIKVEGLDSDFNLTDKKYENIFKTEGKESLKISKVNVLDSKNIEVSFNLSLKSDDNTRDFKLIEKNNSINEYEVSKSELINKNTLKLFLNKDLESSKNYDLTVISVKWENWETIEAWIDWISNFRTNSNLKKYSKSNIKETKVKVKDIVKSKEIKTTKVDDSNSWKEISNKDLDKKTENIAKKAEKLPQTWPETTLLLIFTLLLTWWIYLFKRK